MDSNTPRRNLHSGEADVFSTRTQTPIERITLLGDWYACDTCYGQIAHDNGQGTTSQTGDRVVCKDIAGIINGFVLAQEDNKGNLFLPSGMTVECWKPKDTNDGHWEPLAPGTDCNGSGSGSGSGGNPIFPKECGVPCPPAGCSEIQAFPTGGGCYVYGYCCGSGLATEENSGLVPYSGATQPLNLGSQSLLTTGNVGGSGATGQPAPVSTVYATTVDVGSASSSYQLTSTSIGGTSGITLGGSGIPAQTGSTPVPAIYASAVYIVGSGYPITVAGIGSTTARCPTIYATTLGSSGVPVTTMWGQQGTWTSGSQVLYVNSAGCPLEASNDISGFFKPRTFLCDSTAAVDCTNVGVGGGGFSAKIIAINGFSTIAGAFTDNAGNSCNICDGQQGINALNASNWPGGFFQVMSGSAVVNVNDGTSTQCNLCDGTNAVTAYGMVLAQDSASVGYLAVLDPNGDFSNDTNAGVQVCHPAALATFYGGFTVDSHGNTNLWAQGATGGSGAAAAFVILQGLPAIGIADCTLNPEKAGGAVPIPSGTILSPPSVAIGQIWLDTTNDIPTAAGFTTQRHPVLRIRTV